MDAGPVASPFLYSQSSPARKLDAIPDGEDPWLACDAALDWLVRHQAADGSWNATKPGARCTEARCASGGGESDVVGDTALAVTALCATGWGKPRVLAIRSGVSYLMSALRKDGSFDDLSASTRVLNQALATEALCRSIGKKSSAAHRDAAKRAALFLHSLRTPGGGWSNGGPGSASDLRVTAWATMALADARAVEVTTPAEVYREILAWLDTDPGERSEEAAVLRTCCRLFCGTTRRDAHLLADHSVLVAACRDRGHEARGIDSTVTYLAHVAGFYWGGEYWKERRRLSAGLLPRQHQGIDGCLVGSWDPAGQDSVGASRVASTALFSMLFDATYISTYRNAIYEKSLVPE